jgi:hypothetical protein
MSTVQEKVSAFTSSLLASMPLAVAVDLALILIWALVEITCCVASDGTYGWLGILFGVATVVVLAAAIARYLRPERFDQTAAAASGSLMLLPMAALDVGVLLAAVLVADQLHRTLTTPLLCFSQTMVHKILG